MSRGPRECIEPNIYRDSAGLAASVKVGGVSREKRYPADTPLRVIRQWVGRTRGELAEQQPKSKRGTLAADAERYYLRSAHLASWRETRSEIRAWVARFGPWPRAKITRAHILDTRQVWLAAGTAPRTVNHRVAALKTLYHELDGPHVATPCDTVVPLAVPRVPPAPVTPETIRAVYLQLLEHERAGVLRDQKTRARYMILAASGVRASELARAEPGDVDLEARVWRTRDGKGGVRPGGLYLHDDLLAGWKLFVEAKAWGPFETNSMSRVLRNCGWPPAVRPYTLRHTVGQTLSESGADLADVSAWLGHSRIDTTRRSYVPAIAGRIQALGESIGTRIRGPEPPAAADSLAPAAGTPPRHADSAG
jgi:integrase